MPRIQASKVIALSSDGTVLRTEKPNIFHSSWLPGDIMTKMGINPSIHDVDQFRGAGRYKVMDLDGNPVYILEIGE